MNVNLVTTKIFVKREDASAEKIKNQKCEIKNCHVKSKSRGSLWLFTYIDRMNLSTRHTNITNPSLFIQSLELLIGQNHNIS